MINDLDKKVEETLSSFGFLVAGLRLGGDHEGIAKVKANATKSIIALITTAIQEASEETAEKILWYAKRYYSTHVNGKKFVHIEDLETMVEKSLAALITNPTKYEVKEKDNE